MAYLYRKKFDIRELAIINDPVKKVLVIEPEEYLLALYAYHISRQNFFVRSCPKVDAVFNALDDFEPHACVLNAHLWGSGAAMAAGFRKMRQHFPSMVIITIGSRAGQDDLRRLMDNGVNAHLDRKLSRPADVVEILKTLLYN